MNEKTATLTEDLTWAIRNSSLSDRKERLTVPLNREEQSLLIDTINGLWEHDMDYVTENDGSVHIWGWKDDTPEGKSHWSILVSFGDESTI